MKFNLKDKKRLIAVLVAVIFMGFSLSFLIRVNFGTDPCSCMNLGISHRLGITFGTWQAILNILLLLVVIIMDRSRIGWGTLANMFLIGYSADFFLWLFNQIIPSNAFHALNLRIIVLIPALIVFIFSAAVYMSVDLGTAPYDAVAFIIASKIKFVPFRIVRITWDISACIIGVLMGNSLGIVTVAMAFTLGPVVAWVHSKIEVFFQPAS